MQVFHVYVDVHIDGTCMINVVSAIHSWKHQWAYILRTVWLCDEEAN